jgi:hypothetical protein
MGQPFNASKLQTAGGARPLAERIDFYSGESQSQFAASSAGIIAYTSDFAASELRYKPYFPTICCESFSFSSQINSSSSVSAFRVN